MTGNCMSGARSLALPYLDRCSHGDTTPVSLLLVTSQRPFSAC